MKIFAIVLGKKIGFTDQEPMDVHLVRLSLINFLGLALGAKFDEKIKASDRKKIAFMFSSQMCAPGLKEAKENENVAAVWDKATAEMEKLDTGKYKFGKVGIFSKILLR